MIQGIAVVLGGYLLGGVPFGLLIARWIAGIDVRDHGSGNIGATNVYRVVGKPAGVAVWLLDVGKGLVPTLAPRWLGLPEAWQVGAGMAAVVGHSFSIFLRFKGGKGAATAFGVMIGAMWQVGLVAMVLWFALVGITGYVSVGTLIGAASMIPSCALFYPGDGPRLVFVIAGASLTFWTHRSNIIRLLHGTENRFRRSKSADAGDPTTEPEDPPVSNQM